MDHAYLFPFNLVIDRQHAASAKRVSLYTDYEELIQASHNERLRCCYVACLARVKPVRRDASDDSDLRCFAHVDAAYASVPCPYRDPHEGSETHEERRRRREHNLRKVIENDLRVALEDKLAARGLHAVVHGSEYSAPEPCIAVTGFGVPFEIRGLAPGCEPLWSQPFDGTKDGKPVLFFVVEAEAPRLEQPFFDEHLLQRRPAIVIRPGHEEWEEHTWVATSTLGRTPEAVHSLRDLDLITVDYQRLFGIVRPAETLFILTPYREAIERIETELRGNPESSAIAMLRSFADRLLVQGAGVSPALFGHEVVGAPDLDALLKDAKMLRFCGGDPTLAPMLMRIFAGTARDLQRALNDSREALTRGGSGTSKVGGGTSGSCRTTRRLGAERQNRGGEGDGAREEIS